MFLLTSCEQEYARNCSIYNENGQDSSTKPVQARLKPSKPRPDQSKPSFNQTKQVHTRPPVQTPVPNSPKPFQDQLLITSQQSFKPGETLWARAPSDVGTNLVQQTVQNQLQPRPRPLQTSLGLETSHKHFDGF